jgi:hypothetical protein
MHMLARVTFGVIRFAASLSFFFFFSDVCSFRANRTSLLGVTGSVTRVYAFGEMALLIADLDTDKL